MSYPTTVKGQKVVLQLGNSADPEVFTTVCGITTKGRQRTRKVNESENWDCNDPDALPLTEREASSADWTMSGSGQAVLAEMPRIDEAFETPANWRMVWYGTGTTIVRTETGNAIMTDQTLGAVNGEKQSISLTLQGNGILDIDTP